MDGDEFPKRNICNLCNEPTNLAGGFAVLKDEETGESFNACFNCVPQNKGNRVNQFEKLAWQYGKGNIKLPGPDYNRIARRTMADWNNPERRDKMIKQLPVSKQEAIFRQLKKPKGTKTPQGIKHKPKP